MRLPRVAHLIWFGPPIPEAYLGEVEQLQRLNPRWRIRWWHEDQVDRLRLVNRALFRDAPNLVPSDSVFQLQSDLARYEILHRFGGLYIDTDYRWQRPLSTVLRREDRCVTAWERQGRHVANGFIAATPAHPILGRAVEDAPVWAKRWGRKGLRANRITGPGGMWTALTGRSPLVRVLDQRLLHPVPWSHPEWADDFDFPEATAIHLFGHQRELRGLS